ncbi:hypothetical protein [Streptomyces sp. NPDC056721]|uniref:hypothetical protein n=1 Tax=unclassified Streptomyces TaxID=2593676 RepID=UPI0036914A83
MELRRHVRLVAVTGGVREPRPPRVPPGARPGEHLEYPVDQSDADGHNGRVCTLTGPELLTVPDQAAAVAAVAGRSVEAVQLPLESTRAYVLAAGIAEESRGQRSRRVRLRPRRP